MMYCIQNLAMIGPLGGWELAIIAVLGLLIFGGRLPDVARNMGKGIVEFKKGLKGIEDDIEKSSSEPRKLDQTTNRNSVNTESADHVTSKNSV